MFYALPRFIPYLCREFKEQDSLFNYSVRTGIYVLKFTILYADLSCQNSEIKTDSITDGNPNSYQKRAWRI